MQILVVGGAGYIGSHIVRELIRAGHQPVVLDNFSEGHRESVSGVPILQGDLLHPQSLRAAFATTQFDAVFHFAAHASVPESMAQPLKYYSNNVAGSLNLVNAMVAAKVEKLVFSSTAAVYGDPEQVPMPEDHPKRPVNPYGDSKLLIEHMLASIASRHPVRYLALRYFNAAGADPDGDIGEDHANESHLIPRLLLTALGKFEKFMVFGTDYDTRDGSCVRDFVHVNDIARAHVLGLDLLDRAPNQSINLGSSQGFSVKEVVAESQRLIGTELPVELAERRPGDPPTLIASNEKAKQLLGWQPLRSDLRTVIESAWNWHRTHPDGYNPS